MNQTKQITEMMLSITLVIITLLLIGYNAYCHNFQLLFLTVVTFMNSVGIGTLLKTVEKKND